MLLASAITAGYAIFVSHALHAYLAVAVLALATATSRMRVKLPGINGNMSVNLPFLLTAVVNLSAVEAVVITSVSTVMQCWPRQNAKFNRQQMTFNVSMMAFASCLASLVLHADRSGIEWNSTFGLTLATATLFPSPPSWPLVRARQRARSGGAWPISRSPTTYSAPE
jgi:hypothetical protein